MLDFLHHLFIPRESNNHRARLLHVEPLFLLVAILLIINFFTPRVSERYPTVLGITANISIDDLVRMTNEKRVEAGLQPLTLNSQLSQAATMKVNYMFEKNFWAHNAPDGTTPWVFIKSAGYQYVYAGENLARGFSTAGDAMNAWMASQGHRDNILSPNYKEIGFAVGTGQLTGEDTILIVEMFGSQSNATSQVATNDQLANSVPTAVPTVKPTFIPPTVPPQPTLIAQSQVTVPPQPSVLPTALPFMQTNSISITPQGTFYVAGISSDPLIDKDLWSRILTFTIAGLFIFLFLLDMIIIERKQVVRLVSHNLDHILYLGAILFAVLVFNSKGIL